MTGDARCPDPAAPVGVVALSGPVEPGDLDRGLRRLRAGGRPVVEASNLRSRLKFLAGSDKERLYGVDEVLNAGARILLPVRGGYGVTRILGALPWHRMVHEGVCWVGYSDLTPILNYLGQRGDALQVHGPMLVDMLDDHMAMNRLQSVLDGSLRGHALFDFQPGQVLRHGTVSGRVMGGNLCLLASLAGTPHQPDLSGSVLFLEEVNEAPYRMDRLLTQMHASGMFRGVKALILGDLSKYTPKLNEAGDPLAETLLSAVSGPVVFDLPFGHEHRNHAFPMGIEVRVDTGDGEIVWSV